LLRQGLAPAAAVEALIGEDSGAAGRQLAVLSADGASAGFTGEGCVEFTGETAAHDVRCQANMMASAGVPDAMAEAFAAAEGGLPARLLAALDAGQGAGGDARGQMSA